MRFGASEAAPSIAAIAPAVMAASRVGIAAVAMNAEATWLHAKVFIAVAADRADAAADPGIDEAHFADLTAGHIGSD